MDRLGQQESMSPRVRKEPKKTGKQDVVDQLFARALGHGFVGTLEIVVLQSYC